MNTVGVSSNALFGNSANNFLEPFATCKTYINIRSSLQATILFLFTQTLRKRLNADAQCAGVDIGGRK